ncbi:MAG: energy-coupling factor transporter ATPase [Clostridia bacterium]|nr:energy-coupling factor transporter ATPase [Clostridia bacterium]
MLSLKNVSFSYESGSDAVKNVSLEIGDGEFIAIVGHNGSGKSTLAKLLNGLLLPTSGTVTVNGMDTSDDDRILDIRRHVGMVFQNPDNQIVTTVVREDVAFGPENLGIPTDEIVTRVDSALKAVGMEKYAESAPHMLSGGQKQRIAIAGMLAMEPEILVLDEATAMLDPIGRKEIIGIVRKLNEEKGITVIMITQYMEEAIGCERVIVINDGSIVMDDTPLAVFKRGDELRSIGLDVPAAVELREMLKTRGIADCGDAMTIEELTDKLCLSLLKN